MNMPRALSTRRTGDLDLPSQIPDGPGGTMSYEEMLAKSIAVDLKRIICLMLCGQLSVEKFRSERMVLLEKFHAGRRSSSRCLDL
jgi:hypothetical protein